MQHKNEHLCSPPPPHHHHRHQYALTQQWATCPAASGLTVAFACVMARTNAARPSFARTATARVVDGWSVDTGLFVSLFLSANSPPLSCAANPHTSRAATEVSAGLRRAVCEFRHGPWLPCVTPGCMLRKCIMCTRVRTSHISHAHTYTQTSTMPCECPHTHQ